MSKSFSATVCSSHSYCKVSMFGWLLIKKCFINKLKIFPINLLVLAIKLTNILQIMLLGKKHFTLWTLSLSHLTTTFLQRGYPCIPSTKTVNGNWHFSEKNIEVLSNPGISQRYNRDLTHSTCSWHHNHLKHSCEFVNVK